MKYRINKQKCVGCQACLQTCPGATKIGEDRKAEIIDQEKLDQCGGESVCPLGAIEKLGEEGEKEEEGKKGAGIGFVSGQERAFGRFGGRGRGQKMGQGRRVDRGGRGNRRRW